MNYNVSVTPEFLNEIGFNKTDYSYPELQDYINSLPPRFRTEMLHKYRVDTPE